MLLLFGFLCLVDFVGGVLGCGFGVGCLGILVWVSAGFVCLLEVCWLDPDQSGLGGWLLALFGVVCCFSCCVCFVILVLVVFLYGVVVFSVVLLFLLVCCCCGVV